MDGRANDKKDRRSAGRYCISGMGMVSVGKQTETPLMRTHGRGCGEKGTPITLLTIDVPEKHIRNLRQNKGIRINILIPNLIPKDFMNGWNPQKTGIP